MKRNFLKNKVLVVGQSCVHQKIAQATSNNYDIIALNKETDLLMLVMEHSNISCIIIEYTQEILPDIYTLKADFRTYSIPIIAIIGTLSSDMLNQIIEAGIDDFIQSPIDYNQLHMRISINSARTLRNQNANPLTKLPGNELVATTIAHRLKQPFAILYLDLDHFKAYNDAYGFAQGDQLLLTLAQILVSTTQKLGNSSDFVGHVGGDDFAVISTPDKAELIAQEICARFDQSAPSFYNQHDRANKKFITLNRQRHIEEFPLTTLSCVIVSNASRTLTCVAQVAQIIAELKRYAKSKPEGIISSNYVKDRRTK